MKYEYQMEISLNRRKQHHHKDVWFPGSFFNSFIALFCTTHPFLSQVMEVIGTRWHMEMSVRIIIRREKDRINSRDDLQSNTVISSRNNR